MNEDEYAIERFAIIIEGFLYLLQMNFDAFPGANFLTTIFEVELEG